jgi:hypothetical protein
MQIMAFSIQHTIMTSQMSADEVAETVHDVYLIISGCLGPKGNAWTLDQWDDGLTFQFRGQDEYNLLRQRLHELLLHSIEGGQCSCEKVA